MRFHLFPFRTEKLSSLTPMVLRLSRGRVGSRLFKVRSKGLTFFFVCTCWNLRGVQVGREGAMEERMEADRGAVYGPTYFAYLSAICAWCRARSVRTERAAASRQRRPASCVCLCVRLCVPSQVAA